MAAASGKSGKAKEAGPRAFSEAASEKDTRAKRRGRPPAIDDRLRQAVLTMFPEVKTERGRQDVAYRLMAIRELAEDPEFAWLADGPSMTAGGGNPSWKPGILTELGRLGHGHGELPQADGQNRGCDQRVCAATPRRHLVADPHSSGERR